ncbi:hypothetical protein KQR87_005152 [Citrobacter freundii]|nr:hypothetical protein [Citrobacter freundii]
MKTMKKKTVIITNIYTIFMLLLGVVGGGCFVVFSFLDGYNPLAIVSSAAGNAIFKEEIASYEHYIKWKQHYESSMSYDDWKRKVLKGT